MSSAAVAASSRACDGVAGERSGHAVDRAELGEQLGGGGGVVGDVVDLVEVLALLGGEGDATPAWRWARIRLVSVW